MNLYFSIRHYYYYDNCLPPVFWKPCLSIWMLFSIPEVFRTVTFFPTYTNLLKLGHEQKNYLQSCNN